MTAGGDLDLLHIRAFSTLFGRMALFSSGNPGFPSQCAPTNRPSQEKG
jgi:hypothetical protein